VEAAATSLTKEKPRLKGCNSREMEDRRQTIWEEGAPGPEVKNTFTTLA